MIEPKFTKSGILVGKLEGKVFRKVVQSSKHLFKSIESGCWGMGNDVLKELPADGVIRILDREDMTVYEVSVAEFKEKGTVKQFKKEADHGVQVFLPLSHFKTTNRNEILNANQERLKWFRDMVCQCATCLAGTTKH